LPYIVEPLFFSPVSFIVQTSFFFFWVFNILQIVRLVILNHTSKKHIKCNK
jgi:hypothetical protein